MTVGEKVLMGQVLKLIRLVLVMPATNAISEISFSAMQASRHVVHHISKSAQCHDGFAHK